jgi:uncharacterized protein (DUF433 family)
MVGMSLTIETDAPPLHADEFGKVRVAGTRVTLDTLLDFYRQGYSADELHDAFDAVPLADVHAAIAYYLRHREAVDRYLAAGRHEAGVVRAEWQARHPTPTRAELLARMELGLSAEVAGPCGAASA